MGRDGEAYVGKTESFKEQEARAGGAGGLISGVSRRGVVEDTESPRLCPGR